jgi:hypothetical protein
MRAVYPPYLNARVSMLAGRLVPAARLAAWVEQPADETRAERDLLGLGIALDPIEGDSIGIEQALLSRLLQDVLIVTRPLTGPERDWVPTSLPWRMPWVGSWASQNTCSSPEYLTTSGS